MAKVLVVPELMGNATILKKLEKAVRKSEPDTIVFLGNYLSKEDDRKNLSAISRKIKLFKDNYNCLFVAGHRDIMKFYEDSPYGEFLRKLDLRLAFELDGVLYSSSGFLQDKEANLEPISEKPEWWILDGDEGFTNLIFDPDIFEYFVETLKDTEEDDEDIQKHKANLLEHIPRHQVIGHFPAREIMTRHLALEEIPEDADDDFKPDTAAITSVNVFKLDLKTGNQAGKNQFAVVENGEISILDV